MYQLHRAKEHDLDAIVALVEQAAAWLATKGTDQWQRPWPDRASRDERIRADLVAGNTWIQWDGRHPVATVTLSRDGHAKLWNDRELGEPAGYVHRLVTSRDPACRIPGLGAMLLGWIGRRAAAEFGARWLRIDVWGTNRELHSYYRRQGFRFVRRCNGYPGYPSDALFQKPVSGIPDTAGGYFTEVITPPMWVRTTGEADTPRGR